MIRFNDIKCMNLHRTEETFGICRDEETFDGNSTTDDAVDDDGLVEVRATTEIKFSGKKLLRRF